MPEIEYIPREGTQFQRYSVGSSVDRPELDDADRIVSTMGDRGPIVIIVTGDMNDIYQGHDSQFNQSISFATDWMIAAETLDMAGSVEEWVNLLAEELNTEVAFYEVDNISILDM